MELQFWKSSPELLRQTSEYFLLNFAKRIERKIAWDIYFDPKCFFEHIKYSFEGTTRSYLRESEKIYLEVLKLLKVMHFFKTTLPSVCSTRTRLAIFTTLLYNCRQKSERFPSNPKTLETLKKNSDTKSLSWKRSSGA